MTTATSPVVSNDTDKSYQTYQSTGHSFTVFAIEEEPLPLSSFGSLEEAEEYLLNKCPLLGKPGVFQIVRGYGNNAVILLNGTIRGYTVKQDFTRYVKVTTWLTNRKVTYVKVLAGVVTPSSADEYAEHAKSAIN